MSREFHAWMLVGFARYFKAATNGACSVWSTGIESGSILFLLTGTSCLVTPVVVVVRLTGASVWWRILKVFSLCIHIDLNLLSLFPKASR